MKLKRNFLTTLAAAAAMTFSFAAHADVIMATWGGGYGDTFKKYLAEPFEKETGIKVSLLYGNSLSNYQKLVAQKDAPQIDVVTLGSDVATQAFQEGVFEALDPKEFPQVNQAKDQGVRLTADKKYMFLPFFMLSYGILYRTDLVPFEITSWNDLWDARLKDRVGVSSPRLAGGAFLLMMNKLAGGTEDDVAPGIAKTKTLGRNLLLISDGDAQQIQLITQGEVWVQTLVSGSVAAPVSKGVKVKYVIPKEGAVGILDVFGLVKNAPHSAEAKRFLQFALAPERLKQVADALNVIPTNPDVQVSDQVLQTIGGSSNEALHRLVWFDETKQVKNRAGWVEAWDKEILPMTKR
jgi:putative spermidine/putrescine transport system substrate-binding protein